MEKQPLPCQDKRCFSTPFSRHRRLCPSTPTPANLGRVGSSRDVPSQAHLAWNFWFPRIFLGAAEKDSTPNPTLELSLLSTSRHCSPLPLENPGLPAAPTSLSFKPRKMGRTKDFGQLEHPELPRGRGWEGLKQQQHQREPRERGVRWAEVAQTPWNVRNFPLLSHFPSSSLEGERRHRTPGPCSTVQGRKLWIRTLWKAQLCQAELPAAPQILIPPEPSCLRTHISPSQDSRSSRFPPKSWSSHGAVSPPRKKKKKAIYFQPVICCFPTHCHPGEILGIAIPCQTWNVSSLL